MYTGCIVLGLYPASLVCWIVIRISNYVYRPSALSRTASSSSAASSAIPPTLADGSNGFTPALLAHMSQAVASIKTHLPIVLDLNASNYTKRRAFFAAMLGKFGLLHHIDGSVFRKLYRPAPIGQAVVEDEAVPQSETWTLVFSVQRRGNLWGELLTSAQFLRSMHDDGRVLKPT